MSNLLASREVRSFYRPYDRQFRNPERLGREASHSMRLERITKKDLWKGRLGISPTCTQSSGVPMIWASSGAMGNCK